LHLGPNGFPTVGWYSPLAQTRSKLPCCRQGCETARSQSLL
jgi:hypothetical protein